MRPKKSARFDTLRLNAAARCWLDQSARANAAEGPRFAGSECAECMVLAVALLRANATAIIGTAAAPLRQSPCKVDQPLGHTAKRVPQ